MPVHIESTEDYSKFTTNLDYESVSVFGPLLTLRRLQKVNKKPMNEIVVSVFSSSPFIPET